MLIFIIRKIKVKVLETDGNTTDWSKAKTTSACSFPYLHRRNTDLE